MNIEASLDLQKSGFKQKKTFKGRARQVKKREKKQLLLDGPCQRCGKIHKWIDPKNRINEKNLAKWFAEELKKDIDKEILSSLTIK